MTPEQREMLEAMADEESMLASAARDGGPTQLKRLARCAALRAALSRPAPPDDLAKLAKKWRDEASEYPVTSHIGAEWAATAVRMCAAELERAIWVAPAPAAAPAPTGVEDEGGGVIGIDFDHANDRVVSVTLYPDGTWGWSAVAFGQRGYGHGTPLPQWAKDAMVSAPAPETVTSIVARGGNVGVFAETPAQAELRAYREGRLAGEPFYTAPEERSPYDSGLCCMARHASAIPPWTCDCPCHTAPAPETPAPDAMPCFQCGGKGYRTPCSQCKGTGRRQEAQP